MIITRRRHAERHDRVTNRRKPVGLCDFLVTLTYILFRTASELSRVLVKLSPVLLFYAHVWADPLNTRLQNVA